MQWSNLVLSALIMLTFTPLILLWRLWLNGVHVSKLHFDWQICSSWHPECVWHAARLVKMKRVMQAPNVCWLKPLSHFCPIYSQVSRVWRVLAEDDVLWFRMCQREGYYQNFNVSDSPCWKSTLRDCRNSAKTVRSNWKVGLSCANHIFNKWRTKILYKNSKSLAWSMKKSSQKLKVVKG